jgi:hypothetical protein
MTMMSAQPQPLERAAQVLTLETLNEVNRNLSFNRFGLNILDRWAVNQPDELKALESQDPTLLLIRLYGQQLKEQAILESPESQERLRGGLMPHEILSLHELPTSL